MSQSTKTPTLLQESLAKKVSWTQTHDPITPWLATVERDTWTLKVNDFPNEPMYTLLINDQEVGSFDDWQPHWSVSVAPDTAQLDEVSTLPLANREFIGRVDPPQSIMKTLIFDLPTFLKEWPYTWVVVALLLTIAVCLLDFVSQSKITG